jgi:oxygen-independent coproporphyrinogen III oxidase
MNVIHTEGTARELQRLMSNHDRADYVYMYPPRQAYRPVDAGLLGKAVESSLIRKGQLNLYFHFPFCRQICSFCNLYTMVDDGRAIGQYVDALLTELRHYAPLVQGRQIDTLYLGGGTPSLLPAETFGRIFREIETLGLADIAQIPEIAIESAPDTITLEKFQAYCDIGINRVNIGVQSVADAELALIRRKHGAEVALSALETLLKVGFKNICVDLIYGLEGQTDYAWAQSVETICDYGPNTICAYSLTLRPRTGFAARGYNSLDGAMLYRRYDAANHILQSRGYRQETHVRWIRDDSGGYRQKKNHWAGEDILGIGAGARGYLHLTDYRNGYSIRNRRQALEGYGERVRAVGHGRSEGFLLDEDERRRRSATLGLGSLDREAFHARHGATIEECFGGQLKALVEIGALVESPSNYAWTEMGQKFRDVLVQPFFSQRVRDALSSFDYNE